MSRVENFDNAFWDDPDVYRLSPEATLLYLWSWTNPRCGMAGLYKVTPQAMTESKVTADRIPGVLDELATAGFLFYAADVLWVRARAKRLRTKSTQMAKSVARDVEMLPFDHPLRVRFLDYYGDNPWLSDALADLYRTSSEVPVTPLPEHNQVTLPGTSPEPQPRFLGQGQGQGVVNEEKETPVARARARPATDQDALPADLPCALEDTAGEVLEVLASIFDERGGLRPTRRGVGLALASFPHRNHLAVVDELRHWALAGNGQTRKVQDWVRQYRTFLERSVDGARARPATAQDEKSARRRRRGEALQRVIAGGGEA